MSDTDQIQRDIEATREQLGGTVEALAAKADVKAQAHEAVESHRTQLIAAGAGAAGLLVTLAVLRRRRS